MNSLSIDVLYLDMVYDRSDSVKKTLYDHILHSDVLLSENIPIRLSVFQYIIYDADFRDG